MGGSWTLVTPEGGAFRVAVLDVGGGTISTLSRGQLDDPRASRPMARRC